MPYKLKIFTVYLFPLFQHVYIFILFFSLATPLNLLSFPTRRSSDLRIPSLSCSTALPILGYPRFPAEPPLPIRSEERFSRNAETDLVCRLLPEKKNLIH